MTKLWTIRSLLSWTTEYFTSKDIPSARLDAELLLAKSLQCERIDLYLSPDKPVQEKEKRIFHRYVKRRAAREPVAYIRGVKEFWSREFVVNEHVLIPRPDTEHLIEVVIGLASEKDSMVILELGTGSGCIAVTLAAELESANIIATDISEEAIQVARQNAGKHNVDDRISFIRTNWFDDLNHVIGENAIDFIVSNPPYIRNKDILSLQPEIARYEPELALQGGEDGYDAYRAIVEGAGSWLREGGWLILEIGDGQAAHIKKILLDKEFNSIDVEEDAAGKHRVVFGRNKCRS